MLANRIDRPRDVGGGHAGHLGRRGLATEQDYESDRRSIHAESVRARSRPLGLPDSAAMQLRTSELAAAVSGRLVGPDVVVDGATQDSRAVRPGQLFVPLVAERDGHAFVAAAIEAGAGAYLTSADPLGGKIGRAHV